ncbi:MAG: hypothetical protein IIB99_07855 [Planctomycetes bacterium]|nr:hypothetical protein [Planctomycetota bacterium]
MQLITPRTNITTEGIARSGEVSERGTVSHKEMWDGRVAVMARPAPMHYVYNDDGEIRPMTMPEMIAKGYFIVSKGPC